MFSMTVYDFIITMAACLVLMGVISVGAGVFVLVTKIVGADLQIIAKQIVALAQKGISEDVTGLVGNASALIDALNQLVRTTSGIGVFLVIMGFLLFATAYFLVLKIV